MFSSEDILDLVLRERINRFVQASVFSSKDMLDLQIVLRERINLLFIIRPFIKLFA